MAAPKSVVWTLDPHTRAKHEILRHYLEAWTPILSRGGFPMLAYVDGFAGPGVYADGEDGSPVIALKAALVHADTVKAQIQFLFIEKDVGRAGKLEEVIKGLALPSNFRTEVVPGVTFEKGVREHLLDAYKGKRMPPSFAFIDPFGWTGVPFALVSEILHQPNCEVLINFMFEEINRFIGHPDQEGNFDALFGSSEWRQMHGLVDGKARREALHGLYLRQLRTSAGAKYVQSFEMRNERDVTDYFLFFATNSPKGIAKMKEAMWRVDQGGEFRFSDATNPAQAILFSAQPDFATLRKQILKRFSGHETTVAEVEDYVLAETPFRETHYKKQILAELERESPPGLFVVGASPSRRRGTFAEPSMKLRFA